MCIQELFAGVGVLHLENQTPADPMLADQTPPDPDKQLHDAEESSVTHLRAEITRLGEEAVRGQEKINDLQEQVKVIFCSIHESDILSRLKPLCQRENNLFVGINLGNNPD